MFTYEQIQSLNDLELSVYNYVIQNMDTVKNMKIRDLAEHAHVSTTTILNFCHKVGCKGYSEFKVKLDLLEETTQTTKKITDDTLLMMEFFQKINTKEFKNNIDQCADIIVKAKNVFFCGIGSSGMLAQYGARFFSNIGIYSSNISDPFYPIPNETNESSVLIVLSVTGETEMILNRVNEYKKRNFKIISITNSESSTLAKVSDYSLSYYMPIEIMGTNYIITTQVPVVHIIETLGRRAQQKKIL